MLVVEICSVARCAVNCLHHLGTIFRMSTLKNHFESDGVGIVESENSEEFPGTRACSGGDVPDEAAGLAHALCFSQFSLTAPQLFLGPLAVLDVGRCPVPFDDFARLVA